MSLFHTNSDVRACVLRLVALELEGLYSDEPHHDDEAHDEDPAIGGSRESHRPSGVRTSAIAAAYLDGSEQRFKDTFRLDKEEFRALAVELRRAGSLHSGRQTSLNVKLMIFLYIVAHATSQRTAADTFCIAQRTVSTIFHDVLESLCLLHERSVVQPGPEYASEFIELSSQYSHFNGCIGALDGTHIPAHVPLDDQKRFFNRKGALTMNVLAVVKFDLTFAYILAGAEGSMNDSSLLNHALAMSFDVPEGRFYLADSGFAQNRRGIVVPFEGTRYHLTDFEMTNMSAATPKERFNRVHSGLRVVVERVFGILKRMFAILRKGAPEYDLHTQTKIVYALTGLWNFIRRKRIEKERADRQNLYGDEEAIEESMELARRSADERVGAKGGLEIRYQIATSMQAALATSR